MEDEEEEELGSASEEEEEEETHLGLVWLEKHLSGGGREEVDYYLISMSQI